MLTVVRVQPSRYEVPCRPSCRASLYIYSCCNSGMERVGGAWWVQESRWLESARRRPKDDCGFVYERISLCSLCIIGSLVRVHETN